jgi:multidrug resistance efflux pump
LAVISSPEIDQQLLQAKAMLAQSGATLQQARAALEQSRANAELARLTKERDLPLGEKHAISRQNVDEAVQAYMRAWPMLQQPKLTSQLRKRMLRQTMQT